MARPNVVLILLDQWRFDALGANGPTACRTPHLDRLAAEAVRCTRAYTPIGLCSPARASLLTAVYPHRHGMLNNCHEEDAIRLDLPDGLATFPRQMREAGYRLGYVGKWHAGRHLGPEHHGFESWAGRPEDYRAYRLAHGLPAEAPVPPDAVSAQIGRLRLPIAGTDPTPPERSYTGFAVEEALRLLEELATTGAPFLLQVSLEGPHHPYYAPEPFASWYEPSRLDPWPSFHDALKDKPASHRRRLARLGMADWAWEDWAPVVARYFGYVSHIDAQVGRLLEALGTRGLAEKTLLVVGADHGDLTGSHGQFNKGTMAYEDVYHIPLLARWPDGGLPGGTACRDFVRLLDLGPTFLEAAGLEPPPGVDGRSLLACWRGQPEPDWPDSVFAQFHGDEWGLYSQRLVRDGRFKLVYNGQDQDELYHLARDPYELVNRAEDPAYRAERRRMELLLLDWMERTADPLLRWARLQLGR